MKKKIKITNNDIYCGLMNLMNFCGFLSFTVISFIFFAVSVILISMELMFSGIVFFGFFIGAIIVTFLTERKGKRKIEEAEKELGVD